MSDIYNPYAFGVLGDPAPLVAPPALRVVSGQATPEQIAMARDAFTRFCAGTRLSHVPHPAEVGRLPDGSTYRITDVAGHRVMLLDAANTDDTGRRSGIGISLTMLDGSLVPGHIHSDGATPQPYILTPKATRSGRRSTGKWAARKVNGYSGGKAVWSDETGRRSIVGIGGKVYDDDLTNYRSVDREIGTNNRAYWSGEYAAGDTLLTDGEKTIGAFRDRNEPIPFFRRDESGELWIMQIGVEFGPYRLHLYGEKYSGAENSAPIGELLGSLDIPPGHSIIWQTISISCDGRKLRCTANTSTPGSTSSEIEINILDDGLSISSIAMVGGYFPPTQTSNNDGSSSVSEQFKDTSITVVNYTDTSGGHTSSLGFGYDARGGEVGGGRWTTFSWRDLQESIRWESTTVYTNPNLETGERGYDRFSTETYDSNSIETRRSWELLLHDGRTIAFPPSIVVSVVEHYTETLEFTIDSETLFAFTRRDRNGHRDVNRRENHAAIIFIDTLTGLYITRTYTREYSSHKVIAEHYQTGMPLPEDNGSISSTETLSRNIKAVCNGAVILDDTVTVTDPTMWQRVDFVASSATDPLTGAVCVNILEIDPIAWMLPPTRSWIILADDTGAKHLHEVMDVPSGTAVRVKKDYALLSVV